jgi:hypothetical protein
VAISFPEARFSQDPHGATLQKTAFFIVTAVGTSNPTKRSWPTIIDQAVVRTEITFQRQLYAATLVSLRELRELSI